MRNSTEINREIEKLEKTLRNKDNEVFNLKQRIEKLKNTLSKAQYKEELEREGIYVNIVSVERQKDSWGLFLIKTDKGLSWLTRRKLKIGKFKISQTKHDKIKEINEEFKNRG